MSLWTTPTASAGVITAPTLKSSKSGSRGWGETITITHNAATSAQVSLTTTVATKTRMSWTIGSTDATTDNSATGRFLIISVEEAVAETVKLLTTLFINN